MNKADIMNFVEQNLQKLNFKIEDGRILIDTLQSLNCLYKLLNDDYVSSKLTKNDYESIAKNKI